MPYTPAITYVLSLSFDRFNPEITAIYTCGNQGVNTGVKGVSIIQKVFVCVADGYQQFAASLLFTAYYPYP